MKEGLWIIQKYPAMLCSWFPRNCIWKPYESVGVYTRVCVCTHKISIFNVCIHIYK